MPEALKDENGKDLKTREEVEAAFRNKLIRTFNIDDEENEAFCEGRRDEWSDGMGIIWKS